MANPVRILVGLSLCAVCCVGCGGGGGEAGDATDAFAGTWHYAGYLGEVIPPAPAVVTLDFGEVVADGYGGFGLTHRQNANTTVGGTTTEAGLAYTLAFDGSLTWTLAPTATQPALGGALSTAGRLGLLSAVTVGSVPSVRVLVRRGGSFAASSLTGEYHTVSLAFLPPSDTGYVGTTDFDGVGAGTGSGTTNREGLHQAVTSTSTYAVTPQGDLTFSQSTIVLEGGILAGGDVAVVAGGTTTGETTALRLFVRESTSASLLTFSGVYHAVALLTRDTGYVTLAGDLEADGAGGWTADFKAKAIGAYEDASGLLNSGTYTVAPDGRLLVKFGTGAMEYVGGVSPDGSFATAGGPVNTSEDPALWVLVRR